MNSLPIRDTPDQALGVEPVAEIQPSRRCLFCKAIDELYRVFVEPCFLDIVTDQRITQQVLGRVQWACPVDRVIQRIFSEQQYRRKGQSATASAHDLPRQEFSEPPYALGGGGRTFP